MARGVGRQQGSARSITKVYEHLDIEWSTDVPDPPKTLGLVGQKRWWQITNILYKRGCWSLDWIPAVEHICRTFDQLAVVDLELKKFPTLLIPTNNGSFVTNPLVKERLKLDVFLQSQLNCFGLTLSSARDSWTKPKRVQDTYMNSIADEIVFEEEKEEEDDSYEAEEET